MKHEKVIVEVYKPGVELPRYAFYSKEDLKSLIQDLKEFKKEGRRILSWEEANHFDLNEEDLVFLFRDDVYFDKFVARLVVKKH